MSARTPDPHRLPSPVGQRSPQPLERPEAEVLEPDGGPDQLQRPDGQHDQGLHETIFALKPAKAVAIEEKGAENRLRQIVGRNNLQRITTGPMNRLRAIPGHLKQSLQQLGKKQRKD